MKYFSVLLLALCLQPLPAWAADDATHLRERLTLEILAYQSTTAFCLLLLNHGGSKTQARLEQLLTEAEQLNNAVAWPGLHSEWQKSIAFMRNNRSAAINNERAGLATEVKLRQFALYETLAEQRPDMSALPRQEQALLQMLSSLEKMVAEYTLFHANLFGGHAGIEMDIAAQSRRFEQALEVLPDKELQRAVDSKWHFVKGTLLAYNEKSAVYIVQSTGRSIARLLQEKLQPEQVASE